MRRLLSHLSKLLCAALTFIDCHVGQAQDYRARIQGIVTDSSQGAISGAKVTLLNAGTGVTAMKTTAVNGLYAFDFVEPGIYKTPIFDRIATPADRARAEEYSAHDFAARVQGVFQMVSGAPDNPGTLEVVNALVGLIEMNDADRPFRTVVSDAIRPLLEPYNAAAEGLRPIVAQIFNVPELAGPVKRR